MQQGLQASILYLIHTSWSGEFIFTMYNVDTLYVPAREAFDQTVQSYARVDFLSVVTESKMC